MEASDKELSQTLNKVGKVKETDGNSVSQSLGLLTDFFKHMTAQTSENQSSQAFQQQ